jgi:hypothetical protein
MTPLRVAILRLDRDKRLHIIGTFIIWPLFCRRRNLLRQGRMPGELRPPTLDAHLGHESGRIPRRLVRGLLQLPNMTTEFHDPVGGRAGNVSHRFWGSKISENFCGIFVLLCYIPAPLMNRN